MKSWGNRGVDRKNPTACTQRAVAGAVQKKLPRRMKHPAPISKIIVPLVLMEFVFVMGIKAQTSSAAQEEGVLKVNLMRGTDIGAKISACMAALPMAGGVCDARAAGGRQTLSAITITKPVVLLLNSGNISVTGTITLRDVGGVKVEGGGSSAVSQGTTLVWAGNSASPMFELDNVRDSEFEDFTIKSSAAAPLEAGIRAVSDDTSMTATRNTFRDLVIDGTGRGGLGKGFQYAMGSRDSNNDVGRFFNVEVINYTIAGWSFEHPQSKGHQFFGCSFNGDGYGKYGVTTALGSGGAGGSFVWFGGNGGGNTVADFYLGAPDDAILISGGNFENSSRLLETYGASSAPFPVTIEGTRWSGNALDPDGKAILYTQRGPLNLIGNLIGQFPSKPLEISLQPAGAPAEALAIGNAVGSSLSQPFAGNGKGQWDLISNVRNSSPVMPFADSTGAMFQNVSFSSNPVFDVAKGKVQQITLSGNVTHSTLINALPGDRVSLIICQDSTGGHTFAFPENLKGGAPVGMSPSTCSERTFIFGEKNGYLQGSTGN